RLSLTAPHDRLLDLDADDDHAAPYSGGPVTVPRISSLSNLTETLPNIAMSFPTRTLGSMGPLRGTWLEKPLSTVYMSLTSHFGSIHEQRGVLLGYAPDNSAIVKQVDLTRRALQNSFG